MEKVINALFECDFAALYESSVGVAPGGVTGTDAHTEYALMWNYENDTLKILPYASENGHKSTMRHAWEISIIHTLKQIGCVSAYDINNGRLPDCLVGYIKQGRYWPK